MNKYLQNIPTFLQQQNQWVCACKGSKIPMQATSQYPASSTNRNTWTDFSTALKAVQQNFNGYCYLGYVFANTGIVGIDLDHCIKNGKLSAMAYDILQVTQSYTELSKSGTGLHILVKGNLPFNGTNTRHGLEIYKTARFFVMTANVFQGFYDLTNNQNAIDYILDKYVYNKQTSNNLGLQQQSYKQHTRTSKAPAIYQPIYSFNKNKFNVKPKYEPIANGSRHMCLLSLAGQFWNAGASVNDLLNELVQVNHSYCNEPLAQNEIYQIVKSIMRYKRG